MSAGGAASSCVSPARGIGAEPAQTNAEDDEQEGTSNSDGMVDKDIGEETPKPAKPSAVQGPPRTEKEDNRPIRCAVFRCWCPHCVAAQSRGNPHRAADEESELPRLSSDYGCMSREKGAVFMIVAMTPKADRLRRRSLGRRGGMDTL